MQRVESHARRQHLFNLGAQDHITQPVYVHQLYFRGMRGTIWHFSCCGIVGDRSNPLREFPRVKEDLSPLAVAGAITLAVIFLSAIHLTSFAPIGCGISCQSQLPHQRTSQVSGQRAD